MTHILLPMPVVLWYVVAAAVLALWVGWLIGRRSDENPPTRPWASSAYVRRLEALQGGRESHPEKHESYEGATTRPTWEQVRERAAFAKARRELADQRRSLQERTVTSRLGRIHLAE